MNKKCPKTDKKLIKKINVKKILLESSRKKKKKYSRENNSEIIEIA